MPIKHAARAMLFLALLLAACSGGPLREDVIAQATPDGQIAFDVVKIDDAVLSTLAAQPPPLFPEGFKKYLPPPEVKIAVGDTVSVVVWESAGDGLFGNSLTELSFPAGASTRLLTGELTAPPRTLGGPEELTALPDTFGRLFGVAVAPGETVLAGEPALPGLMEGLPGGLVSPLAQGPSGGLISPDQGLSGGLLSAPGQGSGGGLLSAPSEGPAGGLVSATEPASSSSEPTGRPSARSTGALSGGSATAAETATGATGEPATGRRTAATAAGRRPTTGAAKPFEQLLNVAEQSGRPGTRIPDQQVGPDGAISIPYAGRIEVAGQTPLMVQQTIDRLLAAKALDPQALVIVKRSAANAVSVSGETGRGKRVPLSPGGDRLLQVIAAAGGEKAPVHDTFVELSRDGATATVPLATLVADPDQDIFAEPGDVLTLRQRPKTYSVFGATGKNSAINFVTDRLSLSEALAKAKGLLDKRADPRAVFLFRYEPVGVVRALGQPIATAAPDGLSPIVYRLDLHEARSYLLAQRFPVHDKDIIFVSDAETQPIYNFFQALTLFTGPVQTYAIQCIYAKC